LRARRAPPELNYIIEVLHQAPPLVTPRFPPPPICPLRPISPSFPALTPMPAPRPSYSISPPPASLPDPPAPAPKSLPLPSPAVAIATPASLRSFCNSCHSCCHCSSVVSQPSQTPPCPTPSLPEGPDALARPPPLGRVRSTGHPPRGVGAGAARPPRRGGSTRFRFEPEVTQYRSSLSFGPCTATNRPLHAAVPRCVDESGILLL
jgi:hypothetical protein